MDVLSLFQREYARRDLTAKFARAFSFSPPERFNQHREAETERGLARAIVGKPKRSESPTLTLVGGGSCSGKTSALETGLFDVSDDAVRINPDAVSLPGHESRSAVSKRALQQALNTGASIVYDSCGLVAATNVREKLERARRLGYSINGEYMICNPATASARNLDREAVTGRHVPESFVEKSHDRVRAFLPKAIKFGLFDRLRIWSTEDGAPALVAEANRDQFVIHKPETWRRFIDNEPERYAKPFDEAKHPRGQPENKGRFRDKDAPAGQTGGKPEKQPDKGPKWTTPKPEAFIAARQTSTRGGYLSSHTPEELTSHTLILSPDGKVGVAVDQQGDLQNLFNNSNRKGAAIDAVIEAIRKGARTLDCYDQFLPRYYAQFGFVETGRMRFNRDVAPKDWDYSRDGEPDVVFMSLPKVKDEHEARRDASQPADQRKPPQRSTRYYTDWDAAKADSRRTSYR